VQLMLPRSLKPMLAKRAGAPFDSDKHLFEIKWDGLRCLAFIEGGRVRLQSRQLTELTLQFPELGCLARLPSGTVLDGELVVMDSGKPSLSKIQQRAPLQDHQRIQWLSRTSPATYLLFDLLYFEGQPLLGSPLSFRREKLQQLFGRLRVPGVVVTGGARTHGRQLFAQVTRLGLEGIVAKRLDGPYLPGRRSVHWLKIKPITTKPRQSAGADWL